MTSPTAARNPVRRRPLLFVVGLVLVLAGVSVLGYVAWQYWGTTIVSKHKQEAITEDLLRSWTEEAATGDVRVAARQDAAAGQALALVRIPRFGEDFVVPVIEGVGSDDLSDPDLSAGSLRV